MTARSPEGEPPVEALSPESAVEAIAASLGVVFRDGGLLVEALTHPSWAAENTAGGPDYQRLEFLGDAVLGAVVSGVLYRRFPEQPEGQLSRMRSRVVSRESLSRISAEAGLGELVRLGRGEIQTEGQRKARILTDVLEAVVGALFLDQGHEAATALVERLLGPRIEQVGEEPTRRDAKSVLQERCQALHRETPVYTTTGVRGPPHEAVFTAEVRLGERLLGTGEGRTKQAAQQAAAEAALAGPIASTTARKPV